MFEVLKGHTGSCQRRTCLKWEINGELSALDRKNLMQLLCQVSIVFQASMALCRSIRRRVWVIPADLGGIQL